MKRLVLAVVLLGLCGSLALTQSNNDLEREISSHARVVARRLGREQPLLRRWEYAAIPATSDEQEAVAELLDYVIGYIELESADRGLNYVAPERREALIEEIEFSQGEDARRREAIRRGRLLAVDVLVFVDVGRVSGSVVVISSAVQVETGQTLFSESLVLEEVPESDSMVVTATKSAWAVGVSMSQIFNGQDRVPHVGLPAEPAVEIDDTVPLEDQETIASGDADFARYSRGEWAPQITVRRRFSDHFGVFSRLRLGPPAPGLNFRIGNERGGLRPVGPAYITPGRIDMGVRISSDPTRLIVLGLEGSGFVGAYWAGGKEEWGYVRSFNLVTGAELGVPLELSLGSHLIARVVPAIDGAWYPIMERLPEFEGMVTWAYQTSFGVVYVW